MFGVSNEKYLAFDTPDENALRGEVCTKRKKHVQKENTASTHTAKREKKKQEARTERAILSRGGIRNIGLYMGFH